MARYLDHRRSVLLGIAVAASIAGIGSSRPAADTLPLRSHSTAAVLTERGVGGLRLGRSLAAIRRDRLIGPVSPGCELASPRPFGARIRAPLAGFATFDGRAATSRLVALSITGGARTSRGVTIGTSAANVRHAYPGARVENSGPPNPIQFNAIVVSRAGRDRIWFFLDRRGGRVRSIDLPSAQFCE